jgi:hypothetical protein
LTGLEIALCVILGLESIVLVCTIFYAYKFAIIILRIEDAIEVSLDVLDERYSSITKVLEIPLFADSPEIKQVHNDIKKSRESILEIANILTDGIVEEQED